MARWSTSTASHSVSRAGSIAIPLLAFPQFKASGIAQSDFVLGESEARDGQDILSAHFPGGSGSPTQIVVTKDKLKATAKAVGNLGGVEADERPWQGQPYSAEVTLPPLGVVWFLPES